MNERRIVLRHIRPEQTVFKLESDCARGKSVTLSQEELARINVCNNAVWLQFVLTPHRHSLLLQPTSRLPKDFSHSIDVLRCSLANGKLHVTQPRCGPIISPVSEARQLRLGLYLPQRPSAGGVATKKEKANLTMKDSKSTKFMIKNIPTFVAFVIFVVRISYSLRPQRLSGSPH